MARLKQTSLCAWVTLKRMGFSSRRNANYVNYKRKLHCLCFRAFTVAILTDFDEI